MFRWNLALKTKLKVMISQTKHMDRVIDLVFGNYFKVTCCFKYFQEVLVDDNTLLVTKENKLPQEINNLRVFTTSEFMDPFPGKIHWVISNIFNFIFLFSHSQLNHNSFNSQGTAFIGK